MLNAQIDETTQATTNPIQAEADMSAKTDTPVMNGAAKDQPVPESRQLPEVAADHDKMLAGPKGSTAAIYETSHKAQVEDLGLKLATEVPATEGAVVLESEEFTAGPATE